MKQNIIGDTAAMLLLIIMVGVVASLFLSTADSNVQTRLKDKTISYVDNARTMGKLTPAAYMAYLNSIHNCGEFEAQIKIVRDVSYNSGSDIVADTIILSESELISYMFPDAGADRSYILNSGDRVYACVRRTGAGLTSLASLFGQGGKKGDLICEYSGQVLHDGRY
ncbi:MAG: hypothetical protein J6Y90_07460 [Lachnospiraceae bacterium]|nr:hypothetical protein [Lachnospiraceae bacterium]